MNVRALAKKTVLVQANFFSVQNGLHRDRQHVYVLFCLE
jgi:hypothetical protein